MFNFIMNKSLIEHRFSNSVETYAEHAIVQKNVAEKLIVLIEKFAGSNHEAVLEIGCGSGFLTRNMIHKFRIGTYYLNDISEKCMFRLLDELRHADSNIFSLPGDAELIDFPKNLSMIVSSSTFQWFEDFESFIFKAYEFLSTNSYLIFSTYSSENFLEIRHLTGSGICYPDVNFILQSQKKFEILHSEKYSQILYFNQPCDVLKHIKQTGVNGLFQTTWTPAMLRAFTNNYQQFFVPGKGYPLTYCPQYYVLKK